MYNLNYFITKKVIPSDVKLKYLIAIPCVNRAERNAINVIERTFESFKKSGMFESEIDFTIILFESGSKDTSYLDFIQKYDVKKIHVIKSEIRLDGNSNTLRMFFYIDKMSSNYDFIIWMDDDVFVCNKFLENANSWIKKYANFSLFSSLYVPYNSFPIKGHVNAHLANLPGFYGTCCTIFKPQLAKFAMPLWYSSHFEKFSYNPDTRFRDGVRKHFPNANQICVSYPSLVQHMNIGSAIKEKIKVKQGHKTKTFIGEENDPKFYEIFI